MRTRTRVLVVDMEMRATNWEVIRGCDLQCTWNTEWNKKDEERHNVIQKLLQCNKEMSVLHSCLQYWAWLKRDVGSVISENWGNYSQVMYATPQDGCCLATKTTCGWGWGLTLTNPFSLNLSSLFFHTCQKAKEKLSNLWDAIQHIVHSAQQESMRRHISSSLVP